MPVAVPVLALPNFEFAGALLAFETHIPIFRKVLRVSETLFFRAHAIISAGKEGRGLPERAAGPLVQMDMATHEAVLSRGHVGVARAANCVRIVQGFWARIDMQ